jgi:hypothetical protein
MYMSAKFWLQISFVFFAFFLAWPPALLAAEHCPFR